MKTMNQLLAIAFMAFIPFITLAQKPYKPLKAGWAAYLEKQTVVVKADTLLAGKYEATNIEYRQFLNDLLKNGKQQQYQNYEIDSNGWSSEMTYNLPYVNYYHRHPAYNDYPVVNITHEAATAFCEWLTIQYNNDPKRKYKKVKIKLPDLYQWMLMFTSNDKYNQMYPWGGASTRNSNGKLLANYLVTPEHLIKRVNESKELVIDYHSYWPMAGKLSPFFYTNHPEAFPPNALGCYNVAGNVSEMLETKGVRKGGSFISPGYYLTLNADEEFPLLEKGSMIGFRYFVEVVEK